MHCGIGNHCPMSLHVDIDDIDLNPRIQLYIIILSGFNPVVFVIYPLTMFGGIQRWSTNGQLWMVNNN
jgi:hypothetical protein